MESQDVETLKGVGEASAKLLYKLGIKTVSDLINNIPRKYDDYSHVIKVREIRPGTVTLKVRIHSVKKRYSKKGLHITEALASDDSGSVHVMWFNQPYRANSIKSDAEYYLRGEFASNYRFLVITNPVCELVSKFPLHTARLVPNYKLTKGISSSKLRRFTKSAFDVYTPKETLPRWLIKDRNLIDRKSALFTMHFPENLEALALARRRIGFDELFEMSLASALNKRDFANETAVHVPFQENIVTKFVKSLPFKLTDDQRKASWQILLDMTKGSPMNRLLEGDVGSGKTVVATIAMINVASYGLQASLMAPTELLASQHALTIENILPQNLKNKVVFLSGSMNKNQKAKANKAIADGSAQIIIGTHALFQSGVKFYNLGLAVIDEQHRFGVQQRKNLQGKAKVMPHILNMTATPIPRSLMLTLFGEMDASIIAQLPKGRKKPTTKVLQPEQRKLLYESLKPSLESGQQMFVVCPQIEENTDQPGRSLSVNAIYKQLSIWYKNYKVGLLHGKLKSEEKEAIMKDFISNKYDVLVATTVIEVGVDVPNATIMVVEGADRFGLAQLHQLRGRVGRRDIEGQCFLIMTENGNVSKRLKVIEQENDGFKLAEYDLELRGPGAVYGTIQHGALDLRVAKITDINLIQEARSAANQFINKNENMLKYPQLKARVDSLRVITNLN
jgi:ATP-dependent DNA helicase RecG